MEKTTSTLAIYQMIFRAGTLSVILLFLAGCQKGKDPLDTRINEMDPLQAATVAHSIESTVTPVLAEGLTLRLWGVDSLVADPISIDIDDAGRLYYTRTNRQKNSEFDIRGHQEWEIESIRLQTVEDKRAFLHKILSPENSKKNTWLADLNGDGSHDWKDMTIKRTDLSPGGCFRRWRGGPLTIGRGGLP